MQVITIYEVTGLLGLLFRDKMFMIENVHSEMKLRCSLTLKLIQVYLFAFFFLFAFMTNKRKLYAVGARANSKQRLPTIQY
jgi:hypothetical protein